MTAVFVSLRAQKTDNYTASEGIIAASGHQKTDKCVSSICKSHQKIDKYYSVLTALVKASGHQKTEN